MACAVMADIVMAHAVMAYIVMACAVIACIVMVCIPVACVVMALYRHGIYRYCIDMARRLYSVMALGCRGGITIVVQCYGTGLPWQDRHCSTHE